MDEARFGLKVWYRRRWCPVGHRPPWRVEDRYAWLWLYAAVEPSTGESFSLYMPHLDGACFEVFLRKLREAYAEDEIVLVVDGAGAHRKKSCAGPRVSKRCPCWRYSPELNLVERLFEELRARLANRVFETVEAIEEALTEALGPFWEVPKELAQLTGYGWWAKSISNMPTS